MAPRLAAAGLRQHLCHLPLYIPKKMGYTWATSEPPVLPAVLPKPTAAALPPGTCSDLDGKYSNWGANVLQVT